MAYFTPDLIVFLTELGDNNHKDWFDENRKRYAKSVKDPFKKFITDLIDAVREADPNITMEAKNAIFRINRDIRFSKDKTPYKTHLGAVINPGPKRNHRVAGVYIEINPEHFRIYGGAYGPDKEPLKRIREEIRDNGKALHTIIDGPVFKKKFGEVKGEKNKVLPAEFKEEAQSEPLLFNKGFYVFQDLPMDWLYADDLVDKIMAEYRVVKPFNDFLHRPIEG